MHLQVSRRFRPYRAGRMDLPRDTYGYVADTHEIHSTSLIATWAQVIMPREHLTLDVLSHLAVAVAVIVL